MIIRKIFLFLFIIFLGSILVNCSLDRNNQPVDGMDMVVNRGMPSTIYIGQGSHTWPYHEQNKTVRAFAYDGDPSVPSGTFSFFCGSGLTIVGQGDVWCDIQISAAYKPRDYTKEPVNSWVGFMYKSPHDVTGASSPIYIC
jgi:hypothetical protein